MDAFPEDPVLISSQSPLNLSLVISKHFIQRQGGAAALVTNQMVLWLLAVRVQ